MKAAFYLTFVLVVLTAGFMTSGCTKRADKSAVSSAGAEAANPALDAALADAAAAFQQGAYVKAVQLVQACQQQPLPPGQAAKVRDQMAQFSHSFADMMASRSVNAEARAAIDLMRRGGVQAAPGVAGNPGP